MIKKYSEFIKEESKISNILRKYLRKYLRNCMFR